MKTSKALITSALAGLLAVGIGTQATAQSAGTEKCYGVAKKGANDCATATHSCAAKSAKDNDAAEWKTVAKGTCEKMGGKLAGAAGDKKPAPAEKPYVAPGG